MAGIASSDIRDVDDDGIPWGPWSRMTRFATLKPIVTKAKSVGSDALQSSGTLVAWRMRTAMHPNGRHHQFQVHVVDVRRQNEKQRPIITLEGPSLKGYVVGGLVLTHCTLSLCECAEGDKWGVWSVPVAFMTMPKLLCRLQSV